MVMKLYSEFEPAIQFAKTVGEVEYAKLMELYTAWKSGAFSSSDSSDSSVELGTYYGRQSWDDDASSWPSDLKDGDMFLGEVTGITYVYVASTNTFYPVSNGGYRGEYSTDEKYIVGQLVTDADGNLYACVGANIEQQDGLDYTGYSIGCALGDTFYWALLSSSGTGDFVPSPRINLVWGINAFLGNESGMYNVALGYGSMRASKQGSYNVALGSYTLASITTGAENIALGSNALNQTTEGAYNVGVGPRALHYNMTGSYNTGVGCQALLANTEGHYNVGIGLSALSTNTLGNGNVGVGQGTLNNNIIGSNNTAVGTGALSSSAAYYNMSNNTAIGSNAGVLYGPYTNITALGYNSPISGSNQVQLGNSATTTYVYGTVQNRSDIRDKEDVVDSKLGIDFIRGLRAVEGVWDLREDYYDVAETTSETGLPITTRTPKAKDGSKKRSRKHQWFIAQEVKELCDRLGVDFGGYQDHSINGGGDVLSLGYDEFIPPAVKAIQECWQRLDKLEERISKLEQ